MCCLLQKMAEMSRYAETLILFRNRQEILGLGFQNIEIENKCFQIVKWHILKNSMDDQMTLYTQIESRESRKTWKRQKSRSSTLPGCWEIRKHCPVQWMLWTRTNIKTWNWLESHQINSFLENVKQATAWQANSNNQTRSWRQTDCVVNEVQHAKWISELG